jgi:AraC-like DNA-binding protein
VAATVHANAWACVNVVVRGAVQCDGHTLPARFLSGPFSRPFQSVVPREVASLSIVLAPWVLQPLFGIAAGAMGDRLVDADALRTPALDLLCRKAEDACRTGALEPLWTVLARQAAAAGAGEPALAFDVLREQGVEAAALACGWSARHYRRRFQACMGLAPASWLRITRWEASVLALAQLPAPLAELSAHGGYADQAHLARDTRAFTGATPARLRRALQAGAGHWSLQPARVRSVQDAGAAGA